MLKFPSRIEFDHASRLVARHDNLNNIAMMKVFHVMIAVYDFKKILDNPKQ